MSSQLFPAVAAVLGGVFLAGLLFVPFVVRSYRRRGEFGLGPAVAAFGFVVYGLAILTYTLLPLPEIDAAWCAAHEALRHPQLDPLQFVADIRHEQVHLGVTSLLANPAVQQVVFNIALFVPLGAYLRHQFHRGPLAATGIGFAVSLLVECTQLTGNWFLFPCPYRLFDVDDLLANTLGTAVGLLFAPVLGLLDGPRGTLPADAPRPVTTRRRLLGMLVDLASAVLLGEVLVAVAAAVTALFGGPHLWEGPSQPVVTAVLGSWVPAVLLFAVPMATNGATFGQQAVRLRRVRRDGGRPCGRAVPALLFGTFGYCTLGGLDAFVPSASSFAALLLFVSPFVAWLSRGHRGLSSVVAGLEMTDARQRVPVGATQAR